MTFFILILVLLSEFAALNSYKQLFEGYFIGYMDFVMQKNPLSGAFGQFISWLSIILVPGFTVFFIFFALEFIHPVLGFIWNLVIVFLVTSFLPHIKELKADIEEIRLSGPSKLQPKAEAMVKTAIDGIDEQKVIGILFCNLLIRIFESVFAIIFFLIIMPGVLGPVMYFASKKFIQHESNQLINEKDGQNIIGLMHGMAEWIPARIFALSLAVAGNFDDAVTCWRNQMKKSVFNSNMVFIITAAGALGVSLLNPFVNKVGENFDSKLGLKEDGNLDCLNDLIRLISRVLFIWLAVIGCVAFISLF